MDVRCDGRIQFRVENNEIEVKCSSRACGAGNGQVVLHYYNASTFEFIRTRRFKNPASLFEKGTK